MIEDYNTSNKDFILDEYVRTYTKPYRLSEAVQIGDYVQYNPSVWTKQEVDVIESICEGQTHMAYDLRVGEFVSGIGSKKWIVTKIYMGRVYILNLNDLFWLFEHMKGNRRYIKRKFKNRKLVHSVCILSEEDSMMFERTLIEQKNLLLEKIRACSSMKRYYRCGFQLDCHAVVTLKRGVLTTGKNENDEWILEPPKSIFGL